MIFLLDECMSPGVASWLRSHGYDVLCIAEVKRGLSDDVVLQMAINSERILITNDKGFGEKVYRQKKPHRGIILLRLSDRRTPTTISIIEQLLQNYANELSENFVVVTEKTVRFMRR